MQRTIYLRGPRELLIDLTTEKGASSWRTVIPIKDMDLNLNREREFRDSIRHRYDWEIPDTPSVCVCGDEFTVDHAMFADLAASSSSAITSFVTSKRTC